MGHLTEHYSKPLLKRHLCIVPKMCPATKNQAQVGAGVEEHELGVVSPIFANNQRQDPKAGGDSVQGSPSTTDGGWPASSAKPTMHHVTVMIENHPDVDQSQLPGQV